LMISPVAKFCTLTFHFASFSSQEHSLISCCSLMNLSAENFFATRSRYAWISAAGA
jgi:hypothetical protein